MKKKYGYNRFTGTDIVINESMRGVVEKLDFTCNSEQNGTPTPTAPIPIKSTGDEGKITVWSHGKNLIQNTKPTVDIRNGLTFTKNNDGSVTVNGTATALTWYVMVPKKDYEDGNYYVYVNTTNPSLQFYMDSPVGITTSSKLVTFNDYKQHDISLRVPAGATLNNETIYFMLAKSAVPVPYEPFIGSDTKEISLPSNYVGGSLPNGVADTKTQKKIGKVVLDGSETWSSSGQISGNIYQYYRTISDMQPTASTSLKHFMCDKLNVVPQTNIPAGIECIYKGQTTNTIFIRVDTSKMAGITTADLRTYLASNPITLYYELATPVDVTITIPQIETYEGVNHITTTNQVKPNLTIEAWKR